MTIRRRVLPAVSIILPSYNEVTRLVSGLSRVVFYLKKQSYPWEIILVDDGSEAPVAAMLDQAEARKILRFSLSTLPIHIYRLPKNQGKGAAVRYGVRKARGDVIMFSDIDLSVDITYVAVAKRLLKKSPMVVASRRTAGASIVVHQGWTREMSGRIFTALSNSVCQTGVADVTCGFKGFTRETAKKLFTHSRIDRWVFDSEIVYLARKYGIGIYEMPVAWTNKSGSKVKFIDSIGSLVDLFRIRWYERKGLYRV
jgi:dolichyl-phosphate beta-glucosyltransferase